MRVSESETRNASSGGSFSSSRGGGTIKSHLSFSSFPACDRAFVVVVEMTAAPPLIIIR